jgi:hypothetical protein
MTNNRETLQTVLAVMAAWETRDLNAIARLLTDDFQVTGPAPEALGVPGLPGHPQRSLRRLAVQPHRIDHRR